MQKTNRIYNLFTISNFEVDFEVADIEKDCFRPENKNIKTSQTLPLSSKISRTMQ